MSTFRQIGSQVGAKVYNAGSELVSLGRKNDFGTTFLIPFLLFVVLAPGFVLSLPGSVPADKNSEATPKPETTLWMSRRATVENVLLHAVVFTLLLWLARTFLAKSE